MFRALALSVAAISLAACVGSGAVQTPVVVALDPSPTTQSALRNILLSRKSESASGSSSQTNQVLAFYQARNFQPAWSGDAQAEDMAGEVRAVLARAREQGLSDDDYKLSRDDSGPTPGSDAAEAAQSTTSLLPMRCFAIPATCEPAVFSQAPSTRMSSFLLPDSMPPRI